MSDLDLDLKEAEYLKRKEVLDNISELYSERCKKLIKNPPDDYWTGVIKL